MVRKYDGTDLAKVLAYHGIFSYTESAGFNINCPFHDDPNPSMRIDLSRGEFYCFGCGLSGNAYDFVKYAYPELDDLQACIALEKIIRSDEVRTLNVKYKKKEKKKSKQAYIEAHDYYYGLKTIDWETAESEEALEVIAYMENRGFDRHALNVSRCKLNYNLAYPFIFPILDNGQFSGWVGRTMNKSVEQKRKYFYNDGFDKRRTLCGTYEEGKLVFLCEGFMDYLSLKTRGNIRSVCALLGWHISDIQAEKLKAQGHKTVISALDNDKMGNKGTELLSKYFKVVRFPYPDGVKDVGEMSELQMWESLRKLRKEIRDKKVRT